MSEKKKMSERIMPFLVGPQSMLRESLFRNKGIPYRNLVGILLGYIAAILLLSSEEISSKLAGLIFAISLGVTLLILVVVRPYMEDQVDRFSWGLVVIVILGFGLGALIHQYRSWPRWVWDNYRRINEFHELLLESLFLLGVILGFFLVRNWAKEQKDFVSSLSAVLGGSFVATLLGTIQEGLNPVMAFSYYALGFTMSGTINLIAASRLTAHYTNKRTITSRAILDFLYGSERARIIDGYFLKNFQEDPDYAKRWLTDTLAEYQKLVGREFALRKDKRREQQRARYDELKPKLAGYETVIDRLKAIKAEHEELLALAQRTPEQDEKLNAIGAEITTLEAKSVQFKQSAGEGEPEEWLALSRVNRWYYELVAIEDAQEPVNPALPEKERPYNVLYRDLNLRNGPRIDKEMFRVSVAVRWQDVLEYIVAPGQYRAPFPYFGSVAGLALAMRQTVIMDRDRMKRFRSRDYVDGVFPKDIEQSRGLDEIDFLSYVTIPVVSRLGRATENGVGIVNIDTKIFVTHDRLEGEPVKASEGIYRTALMPVDMTKNAAELYDRDDKDVEYIEELTRIIVPVLELYSKCRVGAT